MPVTLSAAKGLARRTQRSLAARRRDNQDTSQVRSWEVLSPNVYNDKPCGSTKELAGSSIGTDRDVTLSSGQ
jgi:hypothetical protein